MNKLAELKLFIAEAERLSSRSFYQHFDTGEEIGFSINEQGISISNDSVTENIPTIEQMESYLLHFRKFMQKNDRVCIHSVNQYVQELAYCQDVFLKNWNELYTTFQEFLEARILTGRVITHVPDLQDISLLDLFKARTFGDLSHLDPKKQSLHQKLSETKQLEGIYKFEYYTFLFEAGELIIEMATLCADLINPQST